jgi:hypothetical protein
MWTLTYKGYCIHGRYDIRDVTLQNSRGFTIGAFRSLYGARRFVRHLERS